MKSSHARNMILLFTLIGLMVAGLAPPAHAATSIRVAYVTDFGLGSNDPLAPPFIPGSSIFVNALTGLPALGTYTTADGTKTVAIVDVPVAVIDASPSTALVGFDTVIVYQVCDIGSHPSTMTAINNFLVAGGKVMIFDGDRCAPGTGGAANYSTFLFPFTASTPGPLGAGGSYTFVDPSTLTTGLVVGPVPPDAVGDANTFVTFNPNWCGSITAQNTLGHVGFVEAYARTPAGGLVIYEGEDFWFTFGPTAHLRLVFDLMLKQDWDPDGLPCALPASGISLAPPTQTVNVGSPATITATVVDANGVGQSGVTVTFHVTSGPNAGVTGTALTDAAGHASFTYTSAIGGTDTLNATFVDILGNTHTSNNVTVVWNRLPVALCKDVTVTTSPGVCTAVSASVDAGSFDPDGGSVTITQSPSGPFPLGTTPVTLTVTDSAGGSAQCRATVTVVDKEPPKITCPAAITKECTGPTGADASVVPSASDNCGAVTASCSPSGPFPVGSTTVTCTAKDTAGNTSMCTTTVKVIDTTPPVVTCERVIPPRGKDKGKDKDDDGGDALFRVSASDICSTPKITIGGITLANGETIAIEQSRKSGVRLEGTEHGVRQFEVGPGQAVITATDAAGNTATAVCPVPPKDRDDDKDKGKGGDDDKGKGKGGDDDKAKGKGGDDKKKS